MIEVPVWALVIDMCFAVAFVILGVVNLRSWWARQRRDEATLVESLDWIVRARAVCIRLAQDETASDAAFADGARRGCPLSLAAVRPHGSQGLVDIGELYNHLSWTDPAVETASIIADVMNQGKDRIYDRTQA